MLNQIWEWWTSNLVWSLFFLAVGLLIVSPLFLSRSFRKRLVRSDNGIEVIEFIGFIVFHCAYRRYRYLQQSREGLKKLAFARHPAKAGIHGR